MKLTVIENSEDATPEAAHALSTFPDHSPTSPSPGTPGEGGGEGSSSDSDRGIETTQNPHPDPPPEYRGRKQGAYAAQGHGTPNRRFRHFIGQTWLAILFWCSRHTPWIVRVLARPTKYVTARCSRMVINATHANARRIFGENIFLEDRQSFAEKVVGRFCDFVLAVGQSTGRSAAELRARIDSIEGKDAYLRRRSKGGGAIIVTAHMGSFEVGLAALAEVEKDIHVIFKRDSFDAFESLRKNLRATLGIHEAAIDDGWQTWMKLRDALLANHVIVLQADRALPGQKSQIVPFLHGHLRLPLGPLKMALASGSPIIPVFTVMSSWDRCIVFIEEPIEVDPDRQDEAMLKMARSIEAFVAKYPDQWLVLNPAFVEDEAGGA